MKKPRRSMSSLQCMGTMQRLIPAAAFVFLSFIASCSALCASLGLYYDTLAHANCMSFGIYEKHDVYLIVDGLHGELHGWELSLHPTQGIVIGVVRVDGVGELTDEYPDLSMVYTCPVLLGGEPHVLAKLTLYAFDEGGVAIRGFGSDPANDETLPRYDLGRVGEMGSFEVECPIPGLSLTIGDSTCIAAASPMRSPVVFDGLVYRGLDRIREPIELSRSPSNDVIYLNSFEYVTFKCEGVVFRAESKVGLGRRLGRLVADLEDICCRDGLTSSDFESIDPGILLNIHYMMGRLKLEASALHREKALRQYMDLGGMLIYGDDWEYWIPSGVRDGWASFMGRVTDQDSDELTRNLVSEFDSMTGGKGPRELRRMVEEKCAAIDGGHDE